jgi:hypothetical protein
MKFQQTHRQCIPLSKLRLLKEDDGEFDYSLEIPAPLLTIYASCAAALDADMMSKASKRQKWRSVSSRNDCISAFKYVSVAGCLDDISDSSIGKRSILSKRTLPIRTCKMRTTGSNC